MNRWEIEHEDQHDIIGRDKHSENDIGDDQNLEAMTPPIACRIP